LSEAPFINYNKTQYIKSLKTIYENNQSKKLKIIPDNGFAKNKGVKKYKIKEHQPIIESTITKEKVDREIEERNIYDKISRGKNEPKAWFKDKRNLLKNAVKNITEEPIAKIMYEDSALNFKEGPSDVTAWRNYANDITESTRGFKPCKFWTNCIKKNCKFYHTDEQKVTGITPEYYSKEMTKYNICKRIINYLVYGEYLDFAPSSKNKEYKEQNSNGEYYDFETYRQFQSKNQPLYICSTDTKFIVSGTDIPMLTSTPKSIVSSTDKLISTLSVVGQNTQVSPVYRPVSPPCTPPRSITPHSNPTSPKNNELLPIDGSDDEENYEKQMLADPNVSEDTKQYLREVRKNHEDVDDELQKAPLVVSDDAELLVESKYMEHTHHQNQDNRSNNNLDLTPEEKHEQFLVKMKLTKQDRIYYEEYIRYNKKIPLGDQCYYLHEEEKEEGGIYHNNEYYQQAFEWWIIEHLTDEQFEQLYNEIQQRDMNVDFNKQMEKEIIEPYNIGSPPIDYYDDPKLVYEQNYEDELNDVPIFSKSKSL